MGDGSIYKCRYGCGWSDDNGLARHERECPKRTAELLAFVEKFWDVCTTGSPMRLVNKISELYVEASRLLNRQEGRS